MTPNGAAADSAVPHPGADADVPGRARYGDLYVIASRDGARLGILSRPRWTVECDRGCRSERVRAGLGVAETALRDHWRDEHGWDERDAAGTPA